MPTGLGGHLGICCRTSESGYPHQVCIVGRAPVGGQKMTSQNVPLWHKDDFKLKVNETADAKGTLLYREGQKARNHGKLLSESTEQTSPTALSSVHLSVCSFPTGRHPQRPRFISFVLPLRYRLII